MSLSELTLKDIQHARRVFEEVSKKGDQSLFVGVSDIPIIRGLLGQLKSVDAIQDEAQKELHFYAIARQLHVVLALYLADSTMPVFSLPYQDFVDSYVRVCTLMADPKSGPQLLEKMSELYAAISELLEFLARSTGNLNERETHAVQVGTDAAINTIMAIATCEQRSTEQGRKM